LNLNVATQTVLSHQVHLRPCGDVDALVDRHIVVRSTGVDDFIQSTVVDVPSGRGDIDIARGRRQVETSDTSNPQRRSSGVSITGDEGSLNLP
jgi:hypothetical protein